MDDSFEIKGLTLSPPAPKASGSQRKVASRSVVLPNGVELHMTPVKMDHWTDNVEWWSVTATLTPRFSDPAINITGISTTALVAAKPHLLTALALWEIHDNFDEARRRMATAIVDYMMPALDDAHEASRNPNSDTESAESAPSGKVRHVQHRVRWTHKENKKLLDLYFQKKTYDEIGEVMQRTQAACKIQVSKLLQRLRHDT